MSLKQQLTDDMKAAMKAGEKDRLGVIRLINAAIKQKEVDERVELDDAAVLAVLEKMVKQRKDSVSQYEAAHREDLAAVERAEIAVIDAYLPAKLGEAEILAAIEAAIGETGASGPADMGKLMGVLKPRLAVIRLINAAIKQREVDERIELDDGAVLAVLEKMVKQRKDSIGQYEAASREDLAQIERDEMAIIETYLPEKLGEAEIVKAIEAAIAQTGANSAADMG